MKIISNFKDYYDSAAKFGIDESIIYVRKKTEIGYIPHVDRPIIPHGNVENNFGDYSLRKEFRHLIGESNKYEGGFYLTGYLIGIAGQIFTCLKIVNRHHQKIYKMLYSTEEFYAVFKSDERKSNYYKNLFVPEDFFNAPLIKIKQKNIFQQLKVPVFTIELTYNKHPLLIINDELNVFEFYKIIDSFTAFNNISGFISGFISGILGSKENEVIKIDDKYLLYAKGFDKWSFKKPKEIK